MAPILRRPVRRVDGERVTTSARVNTLRAPKDVEQRKSWRSEGANGGDTLELLARCKVIVIVRVIVISY